VRQALLPDIVSRSLLSLRGDAGANDPVCCSRKGGHLTERTTRKAGINECCIAALAAPRTRLACYRPRRLATRGMPRKV
jgi:hypothetical protein